MNKCLGIIHHLHVFLGHSPGKGAKSLMCSAKWENMRPGTFIHHMIIDADRTSPTIIHLLKDLLSNDVACMPKNLSKGATRMKRTLK